MHALLFNIPLLPKSPFPKPPSLTTAGQRGWRRQCEDPEALQVVECSQGSLAQRQKMTRASRGTTEGRLWQHSKIKLDRQQDVRQNGRRLVAVVVLS